MGVSKILDLSKSFRSNIPISGEESLSLLCEVLSALGNTKPGVLKPILPEICHAMASVAQSSGCDDLMDGRMREGEGEAAKKRVLTLLAAMLFQTLKGHRWTPDAEQVRIKQNCKLQVFTSMSSLPNFKDVSCRFFCE